MRAVGFGCIAGALWGTVGVATGLMSQGGALEPALAGLTRTTLGAAVLLAALPLLRLPRGAALPWRLLALFGCAGALFQITLFASFPKVGVTVTVVATTCLPVVFVAIGDTIRTRRMPERWLVMAVAVAGLGVVLAGAGSSRRLAEEAAIVGASGLLLVMVSAAAFAVVAATGRALGTRLHPVRAAGLGLVSTALALGFWAALRHGIAPAAPILDAGPNRTDLLILGYIGFIATGGAYLVFVLGMTLARDAASGLAATLIEPAVAALLAAIVLHERMAGAERLGCLLIVLGLLCLVRGERRPPRAGTPA